VEGQAGPNWRREKEGICTGGGGGLVKAIDRRDRELPIGEGCGAYATYGGGAERGTLGSPRRWSGAESETKSQLPLLRDRVIKCAVGGGKKTGGVGGVLTDSNETSVKAYGFAVGDRVAMAGPLDLTGIMVSKKGWVSWWET